MWPPGGVLSGVFSSRSVQAFPTSLNRRNEHATLEVMADLDHKHWLSRFRLAERVSDDARRRRPRPSADESLTRALEMMALADEHGIRKPPGIPAEDLAVYRQWGRLCAPYVSAALR
jgi:hypothetical protein